MSVLCCGQVRVTPFCPSCGRSLRREDPLSSLCAWLRTALSGLRSKQRREKSWLEERRLAADAVPEVLESQERRLADLDCQIAQREGWLQAIQELQEQAGKQP